MLGSPLSRNMVNQFSELEIQTRTHLLQYVKAQLPGLSIKLQPPLKRFPEETIGIDGNTMRSLGIKQTIHGGLFKGSLMHTIKRTVRTRLAEWVYIQLTISNKVDIASPIACLNTIEERLDVFIITVSWGRRLWLCSGKLMALRKWYKGFPLEGGQLVIFSLWAIRLRSQKVYVIFIIRGFLQKMFSKLNIPNDLAPINNSTDEEGLILQRKIEETETAILAVMNDNDQWEELKPDVIVKHWQKRTAPVVAFWNNRTGAVANEKVRLECACTLRVR